MLFKKVVEDIKAITDKVREFGNSVFHINFVLEKGATGIEIALI